MSRTTDSLSCDRPSRAALSLASVLLLASLAAGLPRPVQGQIYLQQQNILLPALIYAGPKFSTIEIGQIPPNGITTSGNVTTVRFTQPGSSTQLQLKFDLGFRWFFTGPMTAGSTGAMLAVLADAVRDSNGYRVHIDNVFSYLSREPGVYQANHSTVLRFENATPSSSLGQNAVISGRFADVEDDGSSETTEFWGTMVIRASSDKTYGLLRYDAIFHRRGDITQPLCELGALNLTAVQIFVHEALSQGAIDIFNHCADPNGVRVVHQLSGWL